MLNEKHRFYARTKVIELEKLGDIFNSQKFDYLDVAILFGSRALGTFHERSDYDFAVLLKNNKADAWGKMSKVWVDIGYNFKLDEVDYDVIDLSTVTQEMRHSINNGYIVLKGDKDDISRILA
ncbi:MAG: nucleotidyltransferase domain-containing protein [Sulfurimonas sp.]|nr:nucleotidyltransferase domain-containing protein [Sulfurimonas sp.]